MYTLQCPSQVYRAIIHEWIFKSLKYRKVRETGDESLLKNNNGHYIMF